MTSSIYGMNNYYSAFVSPFNSTQVNPVTNFMYGATAGMIYSNTVAKSLQSTMSSYLTSLSKNVFDLKTSAKSMASNSPESAFNQKSVTSSSDTTVSGTASSNADMKSYTLNVSKLATAQANNGSALTSNAASAISTGVNSFKLKVGENEKNISFSITDKDTNTSSLNKMATSINNAKFGVTASVSTDSKTGTSMLKLSSNKTGTDNSFSLSDISGNAVAASGANTVATQAQNAEYTLDGKQYTSQSNTISANNDKVQFTLKKAENKDIKLTVAQDTKGLQSDIKDLVGSYNKMIQLANTSTTDFKGADRLKNELDNILKTHNASLLSVGISKNSDGTLSVDDKKLESAVTSDPSKVKDLFGGYNGIAGKLYSKANEVTAAPMSYANPRSLGSNFSSPGASNSDITNFNSLRLNNYFARSGLYPGLVVDTML